MHYSKRSLVWNNCHTIWWSHSLWQWLSIWYGCIRHYDSASVFSMKCCYYKKQWGGIEIVTQLYFLPISPLVQDLNTRLVSHLQQPEEWTVQDHILKTISCKPCTTPIHCKGQKMYMYLWQQLIFGRKIRLVEQMDW